MICGKVSFGHDSEWILLRVVVGLYRALDWGVGFDRLRAVQVATRLALTAGSSLPMHVRSFQNSDPPAICEIWRGHGTFRGKFQGINPAILEQMVLSKPYFDPAGVLLLFDQDQPVGFVHASFARNSDSSGLDSSTGLISQLQIVDSVRHQEYAGVLLAEAISYLESKGSQQVQVGGQFPNSPFYNGLYGGSRSIGILNDDHRAHLWLANAGFEKQDPIQIRHWSLCDFRPIMDRQQLMIGRSFLIEAQLDPIPSNWCDACNFGVSSRIGFTLKDRKTSQVVGALTYWDMEPLVRNWGCNGMGLIELWVVPDLRKKGVATYMVGESLRQLKQQGVSLIEIQHPENDPAMRPLCDKLGFQTVDGCQTYVRILS